MNGCERDYSFYFKNKYISSSTKEGRYPVVALNRRLALPSEVIAELTVQYDCSEG